MQLPTPLPTDNLYKFTTILGLVMFIGAIYCYVSLFQQHREDFRELSSRVKDGATDAASVDEIKREQAKIVDATHKDLTFFTWAGIVGLTISGGGLGLWWSLHQKHLDKMVRLEAEEAEEKLKQLREKGVSVVSDGG